MENGTDPGYATDNWTTEEAVLHSLLNTVTMDPFSSVYNSTDPEGTTMNNDGSGGQVKRGLVPPITISAAEIVSITLYTLIFILSVVGNLLVIITLIQNKRMRTVTNVFLLNLAVSDLLLAVFCMPFTIIPMLLLNFIFGPVMCVLIRYVQAVSVCVSCFTLVAISLERYFAICRPLHSRKWQTLSHSYKTLVICWLLGFLVSAPIAVYTTYKHFPHGQAMCREVWENKAWQKSYTILLDVILLVLPVIIMSVSYGMIAFTLRKGMKMDKQEIETQNGHSAGRGEQLRSSTDGFGRTIVPCEMEDLKKPRKCSSKLRLEYQRGIRQTNSEKSKAAKKRVIKMLFAVVLEFFICWTPLFVIQTWMTIDLEHARQHISPHLLAGAFLLSYVSSCCNPITYCFMNKNFRNGFVSAFRCCRCMKVVRARNELPSYSYHYSTARTGISQFSSYEPANNESDEL